MAINRADKVWVRLIEMYGSRLAENYGRDVPRPWIDAVEELSDEQIAFGLKAVMRESPVHPPSLGQFCIACCNMPVKQQKQIASIQEQLCEYVMLKYFGSHRDVKFTPEQGRAIARPWTYVYREWWDATRPKGMEKCAECTGVVIEFEDGSKIGFSVAQMLADTDVHNQVMSHFRPGPTKADRDRKNWLDAQVAALKGTLTA